MTSGSLGLRSSGSYGSLQQQQIQNAILSLPIQNTPPLSSRKPPKMLKEKDRFSHWIRKFAPRKKVGMLLLCIVSAAVFMWVLYVGKGEDAREPAIANSTIRIRTGGLPDGTSGMNESIISRNVEPDESASTEMAPSPPSSPGRTIGMNESNISQNVEPSESASEEIAHPPPPSSDGTSGMNENTISQNVEPNENPSTEMASPPPPLIPTPINIGYVLPPGNPCEHFTLPPPPADKKRTGPRPCPVCYLPLEDAITLMPDAPSYSPVIKELTYIHEENLTKSEFGGSEFGGYPSLRQRNDSYDIRESMSVHCGFVRGVRPGQQTGFDIGDVDLLEMESCWGVVVASAIFGAFDLIRQPKNISEYSRENICFHMFVDEETEAFLHNSAELGNDKKVGLWRIIVVRNLPYSDPRRNGKIPKLLVHRLFPNARYSLWVDAKLELVVDPVQILERFLWRKNASFAISRHYRRFDVFIEAEANKAAGKYDNASIDFQIDFYKNEGLTPFSADKWPITSDVPEGCVIVREHIPISNLFTCLWFQEVDRFTSRDQISFSTVRDKIARKSNYTINMFLDCERRNFVIQGYHRDLLEHWSPPPPHDGIHPLPPIVISTDNLKETSPWIAADSHLSGSLIKRAPPTKRGRDRKSKRHRKIVNGSSRDSNMDSNFVV